MSNKSKEYDFHTDPEYLAVIKQIDQSHCIDSTFFWDAIANMKNKNDFRERALEWMDMLELEVGDMRLAIENMRKE